MTRRIERVNHLIRLELSDLLKRTIKDPRLGQMVSITEVEVSPDLKLARVFVSCICTESEKKDMLKALESASGFLRSELVKRIRIRRIPELTFAWDESIERGARILGLIERVKTDRER